MQGRRSGGQGARFYAALCIVSCELWVVTQRPEAEAGETFDALY